MNDKLEKARKGDLETQREVIDAIFNADSFEQMMSQLQPDDEQWLRQLANEKHDARAITLLLVKAKPSVGGYIHLSARTGNR